jgi:ribosomal protein S18 acetylase RimI-like enzyme
MRFSLRKATADDAPALADIHVRARRECMSYLPEIHSPEDVLEWIRGIIPQHDEVWLAEDEGRVVGFFMLSDGVLYHLYVYPELHGQGVGSLLFERVKELSPQGFRLWVFQRNTQARDFYEHRGLRVVELTDGSRNEEREPDALYEWLPSPEPV